MHLETCSGYNKIVWHLNVPNKIKIPKDIIRTVALLFIKNFPQISSVSKFSFKKKRRHFKVLQGLIGLLFLSHPSSLCAAIFRRRPCSSTGINAGKTSFSLLSLFLWYTFSWQKIRYFRAINECTSERECYCVFLFCLTSEKKNGAWWFLMSNLNW